MGISPNDHTVTKVYNGSVAGTKIEVTDNPNVLIYSITAMNAGIAEGYIQVFDKDSVNVTVGATAPDFVIGVEATTSLHVDFPKPVLFTSGFTIASTTSRTGSIAAAMEITITYMDAA